MRKLLVALTLTATTLAVPAQQPQHGKPQLFCHRTANRDIPENTLQSLAYAALMGCDDIELDIRTTQDGTLVLNHDGYLERLSEGMGDVSETDLAELQLLDFGGWMSPRFAGMHIARFDDALRLARSLHVKLHLDVKTAGQGPAIYAALKQEGMIDQVRYGGDDGAADDLKPFMPPNPPQTWFGPTPTAAEIAAAHAAHKFTVANFSANPHDMDLAAMQTAVANGIDAINVDYPRLGADAIGRPVETTLANLATKARTGDVALRLAAIRQLSLYIGFPTQPLFTQLLQDPNPKISHAAVLALVLTRPAVPAKIFLNALASHNVSTRTAAAWALGITHARATAALIPLLQHNDPVELREVLLAISRCPGTVPAATLLPFFQHNIPTVRAAAALALAQHQPAAAAKAIPALLLRDEQRSAADYAVYVQHGKYKLSQPEIDVIIEQYREHMKLIHALEMLPPATALPLLNTEAFRVAEDSSHVTSLLAGYGLWDLIAADPQLAINQLSSENPEIAGRAEWMLVKADSSILPTVRAQLLQSTNPARTRLIHILAWHGDSQALPLLQQLEHTTPQEADLLHWAIAKIQTLQLTEAAHAN